MRIAIVHSFYASDLPSGENAVVEEQINALSEAGHDVHLVARHTDIDSRKPLYSARSAARVLTGIGPDPTSELRAFAPDVVHLHNLFPNFGTTWLRTWTGPIVATLHNFRPVCANGVLFRDGRYCEDCPSGDWSSAIRHACYHGSRIASIPLAVRNARGPTHNAVLSRADALICLSTAAAQIYRRFGGESLPIHVVPNGVEIPSIDSPAEPNGRWLVVSRLTPEKGVRELVEMWPDHELLDIVGAGPEEPAIRSLGREGVVILGAIPRNKLLALMPNYLGLIFPSVCLEMQPTVIAEALASRLPVVARSLHGSGGPARPEQSAFVFDGEQDLPSALARAKAARAEVGLSAVELPEEPRGDAGWAHRLVEVYRAAQGG